MAHDIEIHPAARKHGVADADIRHVIDHYVYSANVDSGDAMLRVIYLGPDRAGNLLEVVAMQRDDGTEFIIHAMRMRRRFEALLPKQDG